MTDAEGAASTDGSRGSAAPRVQERELLAFTASVLRHAGLRDADAEITAAVLVASDGRWGLNIQDGSTGNTVRNNVFYSYHSFRGSLSVSSDPGTWSGTTTARSPCRSTLSNAAESSGATRRSECPIPASRKTSAQSATSVIRWFAPWASVRSSIDVFKAAPTGRWRSGFRDIPNERFALALSSYTEKR